MSMLLKWWNVKSKKKLSEQAVADFHAANPDINIIPIIISTEVKRFLRSHAQNNSLPDMWFNWGGTLVSYFTKNGCSKDLSGYAKENNWNTKFLKAALDLSTIDGNLAGYPTTITMIGIFYRKDIFDKCGLSIPRTFEEFENIMETLKLKGYTPMALCGLYGWHTMFFVEALIEMYAGSAEHDRLMALESSWNTDAIVKTFTKFREYIDKGYFPDSFELKKGFEAIKLLYSKSAVMSLGGSVTEIDIHSDNEDPDLYGYFKLPLSPGGNRMSGYVEMVQFNSALNEEKLAAALKFVDFLYSPEAISKYGNLIKQPVPRKDNVLPENLTMIPQMLKDLNTYGSFTILDQGLPQEIIPIFFKVQNFIIHGTMTPEQAAEYMQKSIEEQVKST